MYRIRRFGIKSTAVIAGAMYFVTTLFVVALLAVFIAVSGPDSSLAAGGAAGLLLGGVIVAVVYAVIGGILTAIVCWIYNIVAGSLGGIEVQVESVTPPQAPPVWGPVGGNPTGRIDAPPPTTAPPTSSAQVPWSSPAAPSNPTTDTAPYDPSAPRND